jgi:hypothetical protein
VRRETEYGSANVQAVGIGGEVFFVQRPGRKVRGFGYDYESDSYIGDNLTLLAEHLTRDYAITDIIYQQDPYGVLWCLRSDGVLLGLTYMKDQDVIGWHRHTTDGEFESIMVIEGSDEDELWAVIKRTIEDVDYRYIERMATRFDGTLANAKFTDSWLNYDSTAASTISGFTHLEGESVQILADGDYLGLSPVSSGAISFTPSATVVTAGLPYTSTLKTMRTAAPQAPGTWQGLTKRISRVITRFYQTVECEVGPDEDRLDSYSFTDATLFSGDKRISAGQFKDDTDGQVMLRQTNPYPWTVLGIMQKIDVTDR